MVQPLQMELVVGKERGNAPRLQIRKQFQCQSDSGSSLRTRGLNVREKVGSEGPTCPVPRKELVLSGQPHGLASRPAVRRAARHQQVPLTLGLTQILGWNPGRHCLSSPRPPIVQMARLAPQSSKSTARWISAGIQAVFLTDPSILDR